MLDIQINSFSYSENQNTPTLQNVSLSLKEGEHLSVLGESGCGKSTLLHLVYGLLSLEHGAIHYKGEELLGPSHHLIPGEPFMKLVSQDIEIMPFISVAENIASHLDRNDRAKDNARVDELLAVVQLTEYKNTKVKNLSGGQKQRVAIAKALAQQPEVLLLDEPFSSIDTFLRNTLRRSIFKYTRTQKITCILATHDSDEAMSFTDRMLLLRSGGMERLDTPQVIYNSIENKYQGGFFGEVSVIHVALLPAGENNNLAINADGNYIVLPHQLRISEVKTAFKVKIIASFYKGRFYLIKGSYKKEDVYFNHCVALQENSSHYLTWSS